MIIGEISFNNFVEIKSAPLLSFGFNLLQMCKISTSDILENLNEFEFFSHRNSSNFVSDGPISSASLGPIPAKKELNPFAGLQKDRYCSTSGTKEGFSSIGRFRI